MTEAIDPVAWPSMEEELATKSRIFVAKLLKSAVERDRESDESQDGESTADGYLVFLVDVLLTRLKGSHSGDTATGLGLGTDEGSSSGVNVDNNEGGVTDASESAYLTTDINELGDPLAQRVPCPRTSGGEIDEITAYPTSYLLDFIFLKFIFSSLISYFFGWWDSFMLWIRYNFIFCSYNNL